MINVNIKNARIRKKWSQQDLTDKYNQLVLETNKKKNTNFRTIGRTAITHWETGRYTPDIDSIPFLCELLEISADDLLDIDNLLANQNKETYKKEFELENGMIISLLTEVPWEQLTEHEQKEIMDSVIEESIKIKKEVNKKES